MSQYRTGRALADIRMKSWPAGRVAQLKLAVQRLEEQINSSLSQSTLQTASRRVDDQVPFILSSEFIVRTGFRQAQVFWQPPPGLGGHPFRQLLFYELQHAATPNFANPTTLTTPQTSITIGGLAAGTTRSFRIRVVNTFGIASVWSIVRTARLAKTRIEVNGIANTTGLVGVDKRLMKGFGEWQTILDTLYTPFGGAATINMHVSMACPHFDLQAKKNGVLRDTFFGGPAYVQFRVLLGILNDVGTYVYSELGERFILSARTGTLEEKNLAAKSPTAFGTFMTPFFRPANTNPVSIRLQAAKMPGSEWRGRKSNRALQTSCPLVSIRNALVVEALEQ